MMTERTLAGTHRLTVRRLVNASPEEVFGLWTDAEALSEFMRPGPTMSKSRVQVDVRVGGQFRIDMIGDNQVWEHQGEYLEVSPPRKLAFTWISKGTNDLPSMVTVEFHPRGTQTEVVLTHEGLPSEMAVSQHTEGWSAILKLLANRFQA